MSTVGTIRLVWVFFLVGQAERMRAVAQDWTGFALWVALTLTAWWYANQVFTDKEDRHG